MTTEHRLAEGDVKIRTSRRDWVGFVVAGGMWFVSAGLAFATLIVDMSHPRPWPVFSTVLFGCAFLAFGLVLRASGVDLTPESADISGCRRRSVPWKDVQAVTRHQQLGTWVVRLHLESGKPVTLPAPTTCCGWGAAEFERKYHRIGQWWLAHRGESWRPVPPDLPRPPVQG